jgi:hypothetical protein
VVTTGFARLTEGTAVTASRAEDAGQIAPDDRPRPDGTRGKRVDQRGEKAKRNPSSGRPRVSNP